MIYFLDPVVGKALLDIVNNPGRTKQAIWLTKVYPVATALFQNILCDLGIKLQDGCKYYIHLDFFYMYLSEYHICNNGDGWVRALRRVGLNLISRGTVNYFLFKMYLIKILLLDVLSKDD